MADLDLAGVGWPFAGDGAETREPFGWVASIP